MTSEAEVWIGPDAVKRGGLEVAEARIDGVPVQLVRISPERSSPELVSCSVPNQQKDGSVSRRSVWPGPQI